MTKLGTDLAKNLAKGLATDDALTLSQQFAALFQGTGASKDVWFDASLYQGLVTAPTAFVDYNDPTHLLAVAGVLPVTADAALGNALCANFTTTQIGVSSRAGSDWSFVNNSPCTVFMVIKPANTTFAIWWETGSGASPNAVNLISNVNISNVLQRATGSQVLNSASLVANTPRSIRISYDDSGANPATTMKVSGQVVNTAASITGAQGACAFPLTIGARTGALFGATASWRSFYAFHRVLNTAEIALVNAKILADTGIVA